MLVHQVAQYLNEHYLDETVEHRLSSAVLFGRFATQHLQAHVQGGHVLQPDQHHVGQCTSERVAQARAEFEQIQQRIDEELEWLEAQMPGIFDVDGTRIPQKYRNAQGVALAARSRGIRAVIVMPVTTPKIKTDAVAALGGEVVLHGDAGQRTAFRTDGLEIRPCDPDRICEMTAGLEATRALIGQFPDPYLIADQTGLGELEICYDNVQWINRRSDPVRPEDPHVANYYGNLSFDVRGRYREGGEVTDVFGFNFVSPGEYHYLFAPATEEVTEQAVPEPPVAIQAEESSDLPALETTAQEQAVESDLPVIEDSAATGEGTAEEEPGGGF